MTQDKRVENWEKEFDRLCYSSPEQYPESPYELDPDKVKFFIENLLTQYHQDMMSEVEKVLTKEHYGISYETDKCIECSNHDRIKEALTIIKSLIK